MNKMEWKEMGGMSMRNGKKENNEMNEISISYLIWMYNILKEKMGK